MLNIWYLCHSGFTVETDRHFLVFDYWKDSPGKGLSAGVVNPRELIGTGKTVMVFASHRHPDHFNPVIFDWKRSNPEIELVLSFDIPLPSDADALVMTPDQTAQKGELFICTLPSNDEGVAFLIELEGLRIFHAGDLNWWHWEGEPDAWNKEMALRYKRTIDTLKGSPIDLAFVPVDPRLGSHAIRGVDYLMRTVDVKRVIPMHFWQSEQSLEKLLEDPVCDKYRSAVLLLTSRGARATL